MTMLSWMYKISIKRHFFHALNWECSEQGLCRQSLIPVPPSLHISFILNSAALLDISKIFILDISEVFLPTFLPLLIYLCFPLEWGKDTLENSLSPVDIYCQQSADNLASLLKCLKRTDESVTYLGDLNIKVRQKIFILENKMNIYISVTGMWFCTILSSIYNLFVQIIYAFLQLLGNKTEEVYHINLLKASH